MNFGRDLRYAFHTLRASPAYALMCICILALGIGANAAIFSVLDSVVLNALPYPDPSRLVFIWERFPGLPAPIRRSNAGGPQELSGMEAPEQRFCRHRSFPWNDPGRDQRRPSAPGQGRICFRDRKSTRLNSSHLGISYA